MVGFWVKLNGSDKHSSLLQYVIDYLRKRHHDTQHDTLKCDTQPNGILY